MNEQITSMELWSIHANQRLWCLSLKTSEVSICFFDKFIMIDLACTADYDVLSEVVRRMKINNHVSGDLVDVVDLPKDRLAHHVVFVDVVVDTLHASLKEILISCKKLLPNCVFLLLQMIVIVY